MKKVKLFLLPALVLAMVASLTAGIVAANFGTKAKVNAEAEKWTVAGSINNWNPTDDTYILTLQEDGVTYKSAAIVFVVGDQFKVLKDNSWSVAYPSDNWVVSDGVGAGTYYVVYNSNNHEVSLEAVPEEPVFKPDADTYYLVGEFDGANCWAITETSIASVARTGDNGAFYNLTLKEGDKIKAEKGAGVWTQWNQNDVLNKEYVTFDGDANGVVKADGEYNIYVNTSNELYIEKVSDDFDLSKSTVKEFSTTVDVLIPGTKYTAIANNPSKQLEYQANGYNFNNVSYGGRLYLDGGNALKFTAPADGAFDIVVYNATSQLKNGSSVVASSDDESAIIVKDDYLTMFRGEAFKDGEYTLSSSVGGFCVYAIYFRDEAYLAAEARAKLVEEKVAAMRADQGCYLFGIDGEWEFSETKLDAEPSEGDNAKGAAIALAKDAAVKVRYVPAEGDMVWNNWDQEDVLNNEYVTFDVDGNAVIKEAASYDIFVNGSGVCYIRPVAFEDLGLSAVRFNVSSDGYILFVAAFDLTKVGEGNYTIGFEIDGVESVDNVYYSAISLSGGVRDAKAIFGDQYEGYKLIVKEIEINEATSFNVKAIIKNGDDVVAQRSKTIAKG